MALIIFALISSHVKGGEREKCNNKAWSHLQGLCNTKEGLEAGHGNKDWCPNTGEGER